MNLQWWMPPWLFNADTRQDKENEIIIAITQSTLCDISRGKSSPKNMGSHIKTGLEGVVHPKKETIIWPFWRLGIVF